MSSKMTEIEGLSQALPDALLGVQGSGVIRFANHQAESLFGRGPGDLLGTAIEKLVPGSLGQVQVIHRGGHVEASSGRGLDLTPSGLRADGTEFPVDIAWSRLDTGDGIMVIASVRDMTLYRTGESDQRRADRLLAIVEHSDDAIIATTLDGIITSWNPAAEKIFGYTIGEIMGQSASILSPQGRAGEVTDLLARVSAGQSVAHLETERVRKDGTVLPTSLTVSPIRGADGTVTGASTIARDVSEAKLAFEAARSMIETSLDSLVAISPEGKITDANEATVRLTGVPRDKLIGTSFSDYFTDPGEVDEVYRRVFAQEPAAGYQLLSLRHHDGRETITEVLYNVSAYRDTGGSVLGVFAAARDVTDQKKAAQYARSLIEATLDSLVAISREGRITDVNEAMVRLTGIPRDRLIGTYFSEHFTDPEQAEEVYQLVFERGSVTDHPLTLRHRNGQETRTEVLYNASAYRDASGAVLGVVAAARDVTDEMQAVQYARSLIEAALDPLVMISPEGKITDVNEAMVTLTGAPRDELIGTSFSDYFTDPQKAEQVYQLVSERGSVTDLPLTLLHHNGHETRTEVLYNASVCRDTSGNVLGVFAAARDVTTRMQAERAMAAQQAAELGRLEELERFQRLTVGRELRMIELKKEIEYLRKSRQAERSEPDHGS